ncbi:MAG: PCRF domain-containing protein, partial [Chloroflexota bacterium]
MSGRGWKASGGVFDLPAVEAQILELETQSGDPNFWDDPRSAQAAMRTLGDLRNRVGDWQRLTRAAEDLAGLSELAADDPDLAAEVGSETATLASAVDQLELDSTLSGPYDSSDAILVIHSGEGGVDAQDWAEMLTRMYVRWAERRGLKAEIIDITDGEEAGIKNATIEIRGTRAYGYAKAERGGHRLGRMSPFDAAHRRHTAFALVEVLPEMEGDASIEIKDDDVRV